jgi:hypothetical protein
MRPRARLSALGQGLHAKWALHGMAPEFAPAVEAAEEARLFAVAKNVQVFGGQVVSGVVIGDPEQSPPTGEFGVRWLVHLWSHSY